MRSTLPAALLLAASSLLTACKGYDARLCDEIDTQSCDQIDMGGESLASYRHNDPAQRPMVGQAVDVRTVVVTAIDSYLDGANGNVGDVWVQEVVTDENFTGCAPKPGGGGRVCGIQLFGPSVIPSGTRLLEGDIVNIRGGIYEEFNCGPCCPPPREPCTFPDGRSLPELSRTTVERVGSARLPDPVEATLAEIAAAGDAYVGVLVRVPGEITLGLPDRRGEIPLGDGINLTAQLTPIVDPQTGAPLGEGTVVRNLTGIVSYFYGPKLIPRTSADYEVVR